MLSSLIKRIKNEIKYITSAKWTFFDVGKHWDETTNYDDINEKTYTYFRRFIDVNNFFNLPEKKYTLDICSRTGNGSLFFWKKGKISRVVCADVTQKMQEICKNHLSQYPINFKVQYFDSYPLPFNDDEFETILNFETIEHLPNPKIFVQELYRILKPEGYLVLTTPNILWEPVHWIAAIINKHHSEGPHRFIRHKKIKKWLQKTGFKITKEKTFILIPGGSKKIIKLGEIMESKLPKFITTLFGLRRIYICQK